MISIIMPTYNRAHTLKRAIDSILAQDCADWELILVDDGSTDSTEELLRTYTDRRIRVLKHQKNRGVTAAINTGLDNIKGEWFTLLGSDDELTVPDSLSTLLEVPRAVDSRINAITCNCRDTTTGGFSGVGLDRDQFLDAETIMRRCSGEHWGLTKTELLQGERFSEELRGMEDVLWNRINKRALRYYIHKALRVYHTEGDDRISGPRPSADGQGTRNYTRYAALINEKEYVTDLRRWNVSEYGNLFFSAGLSFLAMNDRKKAFLAARRLLSVPRVFHKGSVILMGTVLGNRFIVFLKRFWGSSGSTT